MLKRMSNRKVVRFTPVDSGDLRFLARWHPCDPPLHTWGYKRLMYPTNSLCFLNDQALGSSPTCTSGGWTTTCQCFARSSLIDPERTKSSFRWDFGGLLLPSILRPELLSPRTAMQVFVLKVLAVGDIKLSLNHGEPDFDFALIKVFLILWNFHEKHVIDEVPFFTHEVSSAQSSEQQNNY